MTLTEKDREIIIKYRIKKARESIADAQFLIDNDRLELAVNRCYYGMFYILTTFPYPICRNFYFLSVNYDDLRQPILALYWGVTYAENFP